MHSGQYYYDRHHHQWFDIDNRPHSWDLHPLERYTLEPELVKSLRSARKTGKFLMVSNKNGQEYRGIITDYIYMDTASLKFFLYPKDKHGNIKRRIAYWYSETNYGNITHYINFECVVNKNKVLKMFIPDYSQVVNYVEDVSYYGPWDEEEAMKFRKSHFDILDDEAKLYYQLEGKYNLI